VALDGGLAEVEPGGDLGVRHADQDPSMIGYTGQVTLPGYDNMTGLDSPDGPRFTQFLRELARS
jgi:hypothetical protein